MTGDVLIDTNVFVYAYDPRVRPKQEMALAVLRRLVVNGRGRISTQILGEFFAAGTRKLEPPLAPADAAEQVTALAAAWPVLAVTPLVVLEAARGAAGHGLGYWDAQIWATARLNQIPLVLTEDFADRRLLEGVQFLNPFSPAFDPAALD
jgi:predicted nucleic acid-binding protein